MPPTLNKVVVLYCLLAVLLHKAAFADSCRKFLNVIYIKVI